MLCIQELDHFGYTLLLVSLRLFSISAVYPRVKTFWIYTNASYIFIFITGLFIYIYICLMVLILKYILKQRECNWRIGVALRA